MTSRTLHPINRESVALALGSRHGRTAQWTVQTRLDGAGAENWEDLLTEDPVREAELYAAVGDLWPRLLAYARRVASPADLLNGRIIEAVLELVLGRGLAHHALAALRDIEKVLGRSRRLNIHPLWREFLVDVVRNPDWQPEHCLVEEVWSRIRNCALTLLESPCAALPVAE